MTTPRLRTFGALGLSTALAACFHLSPPKVAPSGTLGPRNGREGPRTTGELGIAFAGPRGVIENHAEAAVTVLFNRPMRALESDESANVPALDVRTKDGKAIAGSLRWVGTRGLLFQPTDPLPGGTSFIATVPSGIRSLDGESLRAPYELGFESPRLQVSEGFRKAGPAILAADARLAVLFNQRVDPAAVAKAVRLVARGKDSDAGVVIPVKVVPVTALADARYVEIVPEKPLPLDSEIQLTISAGLTGLEGPGSLEKPYVQTSRTFGPLRLLSFRCPRTTVSGPCAARNDLRVTLSTPVMPDELLRHVVLPGDLRGKANKPKVAQPTKPSTQHYLGADPKPGKRYKVTLKAGMKDIFGQRLEKDETFEVAVEAPFVGKKAGKKPAAEEPSQPRANGGPDRGAGPSRAKLDHRLELGLRGHLVEASATTGQKSHKVPVGAINLPTYGRLAAPLDEVQTVSFLGAKSVPDFLEKNRLVSTLVTTGAAPNVRAVETLDLDALLGPKARGNVLAMLDVPGESTEIRRLVSVTDLGITTKASRWGTLVWVTHLSTGKPAAGAMVSVRSAEKGELWKAAADGDGVVIVPATALPLYDEKTNRQLPAIILAREGDDWTHLSLDRGSTDRRVASSFQDFGARSEWVGIVYTDRGVYRPGEKLKLSGLFRGMDATGLRTVVGKDVRLALSDERGVVIATAHAATDRFGSFAGELAIPRAAHLGEAKLTATVQERGSSAEASTNVKFLAYKASEFKVAVEPGAPSAVRGDEVSFTVRGEFLFGAPMADSKVRTVLRRSETSFSPPHTAGFSTSDEGAREESTDEPMRAAELGESEDKLDQDGRLVRKARLTLPGQRGPERVTLEADVEDLSRQTVANRSAILVHPAEFYLGVRLPADRFVNAGALLSPEVIAVDPQGVKRAGVAVHVELWKRSWTTAVEEQPSGIAARGSRRLETSVGSCDVTTGSDAKSCDLRVGEGGSYFVRVTAKDGRGQPARASASFYGIDSPSAAKPAAAWEARDDGQLKLELNKAVFQPGETARVLVQNPFKEAEALVTVERNGVLTRKIVPLRGAMPVVEIPVQADYYPNAYISVHAIRGRIQAPPAEGTDLGGPEFRAGYAELKLDPEAHRLKVSVAPDRKEYRPGEEVTTEVTVTDRAGKPMESAFTFYAVDEGVLMLTSYKTPDPLPPFTKRRPLALFTSENREGLASLLPLRAGERVPILGWEYEIARAGYDKGQDGGGGSSPPLRADFRTTAFFEAGRTTNGEGKATVKVKLPDNLTTFRLMAVAAGTGDHFGSGESSIITSRKLMARPALPRTLRVGDQLFASVLVSSKEATGGPVKVTLKASNIGMLGDKTQTSSIQPGKSVEVRFPVKATAPGTATFEYEVEGAGESDRVRVTREVELPLVMEKVSAYGETTKADAIKLTSLDRMRSDRGELEVKVAPTALVGVSDGIEELLEYPYGCTEQLTSRILPLLALADVAKEFGIPATAKDRVDEAIPKMLATQRADGGFGFWDDSVHGSVWLTAYVSLAFDAAKKQGHYIPVDARDQTTQFLREALRQATASSVEDAADEGAGGGAGAAGQAEGIMPGSEPTKDQKATLSWAEAAFAGDALATTGQADPGALSRLFDTRKGRPLFARAMLLHGMAAAGLLPTQVEELAKELESELSISASQAVATASEPAYLDELLDSQARRTALVLRALLAANAAHPLAPRLARGLLGLRRDGGWDSTQDTAWSLLALGAYRKAQENTGTDVEARVFLGDENILRQGFRGTGDREVTVKVPAEKIVKSGGESLAFQAVGEGKVFWSAVLTHAPKELPKTPRDEGFFVQKLLRKVSPKDLAAAVTWIPKQSEAAVDAGDLVLVDLLLESSEHQRQVVVDDPLPAGLEALDARLDTTADIQAVGDDDGSEAEQARAVGKRAPRILPANAMTGLGGAFRATSVHREIHDDKVLTFIEDLPPGLYHFRYLARATSVGTFVMPPTRAEAMYRPDVSGRTAAATLEVRPKKLRAPSRPPEARPATTKWRPSDCGER